MTEEEYFRKSYPDACYGDKPLSPYWDYFQDGVEFGERESEDKIADLEQKLEQTEKDLADYQFNYPTIKELQKENAELKKTYRKQRNKRIDELQKKNTELEKKLKALEGQTPWKDIKDKSEVIGKLAAAKEIMKRFVRLSNSSRSLLGDTWLDTLREAEQFLKDCDIDNAIQQANKGLDFDKIADEMKQDLKDSEVDK